MSDPRRTEERVRALLGDLGDPGPVPEDVAARLDATLRGLPPLAPEGGTATPGPAPAPVGGRGSVVRLRRLGPVRTHRSSRWFAGVAAAAVVAGVVGLGTPVLRDGVLGPGSGADSADSDASSSLAEVAPTPEAADGSVGGSTDEAEAPVDGDRRQPPALDGVPPSYPAGAGAAHDLGGRYLPQSGTPDDPVRLSGQTTKASADELFVGTSGDDRVRWRAVPAPWATEFASGDSAPRTEAGRPRTLYEAQLTGLGSASERLTSSGACVSPVLPPAALFRFAAWPHRGGRVPALVVLDPVVGGLARPVAYDCRGARLGTGPLEDVAADLAADHGAGDRASGRD